MSGFFKKAMGIFVEYEDATGRSRPKNDAPPVAAPIHSPQVLNADELDKFEQHFEKLFDGADLPGPDYYEFMRMSDTLEAHIKDEKARHVATFASLAIQGLTKDLLIQTAARYKEMVLDDRKKFEHSAQQKSEGDIGRKRQELLALEEKIRQHDELIKKLTDEISQAQQQTSALKSAVLQEESRLEKNKQGYLIACQAMITKIDHDINQIQNEL